MAMSDLFTSSYQLTAEVDSFASTEDGRYGLYTMKDRPYVEVSGGFLLPQKQKPCRSIDD